MNKYYIALGILGLAILLSIIGGFSIVDSPFAKRAQALDKERLSDFGDIKYAIDTYYQKYYRLPSSLNEVKAQSSYQNYSIQDPQTKKIYDYREKSTASYELCTEFSTDTTTNSAKSNGSFGMTADAFVLPPLNYETSPSTTHSKGYDCITYTVKYSTYYSPTPTPSCQAYEKYGTITLKNATALTISFDTGGSTTVPRNSTQYTDLEVGDKAIMQYKNCIFTIIKYNGFSSSLTPTPPGSKCDTYSVTGKVVSDQGSYISITFDEKTASGQDFLNASRSGTYVTMIGNPSMGDRVQVQSYSCTYTITVL